MWLTSTFGDLMVKKEFKDTNLWIDSTDFPIYKPKGADKKSPSWSYKLNSIGRRYMVLCDGKRKVRKLWGGYSPKIYDGHFLEMHKDWLNENLKGSTVVTDNHFSWGRKNLKNVKFLVNYPESNENGEENSKDEIKKLTKEKKKFNENHKHCRARVESPFGIVKSKFKILSMKTQEREEQQDLIVKYAFGLFNASLKD